MYKRFGKRILDFTIAAIGIIFLSPLFLLITILLYFLNKGKPFFLQQRPGLDETVFTLIKFRTMKDLDGETKPDSQRITETGKF